MKRQEKQLSEQRENMSRREFLLRAAETAVLALFGSASLARIAYAVETHIQERRVMNTFVDSMHHLSYLNLISEGNLRSGG